MSLVCIERPQALAVSEEAVWDHLRLDLDEGSPAEPADREHVRRLIEGAIAELDGADGLLSRALIAQTWALDIDYRFPSCVEIPLPPCREVLFISYVGPDMEERVLDPASYRVSGLGGAAKAEIKPAPGYSWPSIASMQGAARVAFVAGYGETAEDIPAAIRSAVLETVATRYALRETVVPTAANRLPSSAQDALEAFRVRSF